MKKIILELSEEELRHLAEMAAMSISLLSTAKNEIDAKKAEKWQQTCAAVLKAARGVNAIGKDMELHPELRHWFFTPAYVNSAFFTELLDEARDATFWSELVGRMAEHTLEHALPAEELETMSDEERTARTSSLESALWHEVSHHGLDRLIFMLPEEDS